MTLVKKGDHVTLTEAEQKLADYLARCREHSNVNAGVVRPMPLMEDRDGVTQNLMGVEGELAFSRLANVYPDLSTHLRRGGPDCVLHSGQRVDVKTTPYINHPLLVVSNVKRAGDVDLYALMKGVHPEYEFVGWAPAERVLSSVKDIGHGPSHVLEPHELETCLDVGDEGRQSGDFIL